MEADAGTFTFTLPNGYKVKMWGEGKFADINVPASLPGTQHTVTINVPGDMVSCSCKGFQYRTKCRHLKLVQDAMGQDYSPVRHIQLVPQLTPTQKKQWWELRGAATPAEEAAFKAEMAMGDPA